MLRPKILSSKQPTTIWDKVPHFRVLTQDYWLARKTGNKQMYQIAKEIKRKLNAFKNLTS